jgi:hypothetical protein
MPPDGKLAAADISDLAEWVKQGGSWPPTESPAHGDMASGFDLAIRRANHWAWRPIKTPTPPAVYNSTWPANAIDHFVLRELERRGLAPAPPAPRQVLIRRLYFDLIGLPPSPQEVDKFLQDDSAHSYEKAVDRLLSSQHFGERWARHWLDLVRYAETYGHEQNPDIPQAWRYRDYVIRAFNSDVPYNQFVREQVAGDLIKEPRRNSNDESNESIQGTGFYWLGEQVHSPVDLALAQADGIDNQIDVLTKTFLGVTVSCARCHDHKFDAISQNDYYALFGILRSSRLSQVCTDASNLRLVQLEELERTKLDIRNIVARRLKREVASAELYMTAAAKLLYESPTTESVRVHGRSDVVVEDFKSATFEAWEKTGDAFGEGPQPLNLLLAYMGPIDATTNVAISSPIGPADFDRTGALRTGKLTSGSFELSRRYLVFSIAGGSDERTSLQLLVDDHVVLTTAGRDTHQMRRETIDVHKWIGRQARIRLVDSCSDGPVAYISVGQILLTDSPPTPVGRILCSLTTAAKTRHLDPRKLARWVEAAIAESTVDSTSATPLAALQERSRSSSTGISTGPTSSTVQSSLTPVPHSFPAQGFEGVLECGSSDGWSIQGDAFSPIATKPGDFVVGPNALHPIDAILNGGWNHSGLRSLQLEGILSSPTFRIDKPYLHLLVVGNEARARIHLEGLLFQSDPLYGVLKQPVPYSNDTPIWLTIPVGMWRGKLAYLEIVDMQALDPMDPLRFKRGYAQNAQIGFRTMVLSDSPVPPVNEVSVSARIWQACPLAATCRDESLGRPALDKELQLWASCWARELCEAIDAWAVGETNDRQASLLSWLVKNQLSDPFPEAPDEFVAPLVVLFQKRHKIEQTLAATHWALACTEGKPIEQQILIRGNPNILGATSRRGFLTAIDGEKQPPIAKGSGRQQLAERLVDPTNPLVARVWVNRIWQHLMGYGIVRSVDNFGVRGDPPSHPDLLDYLANVMRDEWSTKKLIRRIVLSQTYRQSSRSADSQFDQIDPENVLLHRANVRRLEAESIHDALLAMSDNLDQEMFGPPVARNSSTTEQSFPNRLDFNRARKGQFRRAIYHEVDRNYLMPLLVTFDFPKPTTCIGSRNLSSSPAQSLFFMNDELVHKQSYKLAVEVFSAGDKRPEARLDRIYRIAFARSPTMSELSRGLEFLDRQAEVYAKNGAGGSSELRCWADLCHAVFNMKEFIYIY